MHNFFHCHLLINSFNAVVTLLLDENKKHVSATEKKGICSRDLFYVGYLLPEILIDVSESPLKYFQKLQFHVFFN